MSDEDNSANASRDNAGLPSRQESRRSLVTRLFRTPDFPPVNAGVCLAPAGEGYVWVRLDESGRLVRAVLAGLPAGVSFEPGDELGVEAVDGAWQTLPDVRREITHPDRREFWTTNRNTGNLRMLAEIRYDQGGPDGA